MPNPTIYDRATKAVVKMLETAGMLVLTGINPGKLMAVVT